MVKKCYQRALQRNLNEIGRAILNRRAIIGLLKAETFHALGFIRLSNWALFNDMIAHSIKVLEKRKGNASFYYIYSLKEKEINKFIAENGIDFDRINNTADSLLHIRDKTHFHIDRKAVEYSKKVWHDGGVSGNQLAAVLDDLFIILNYLHYNEFGEPFELPEYDGSDATEIAKFAERLNSQL
jgi:hypothetical protein